MKIKEIFLKIKEFIKACYLKNKKLFFLSLTLIGVILISGFFVLQSRSVSKNNSNKISAASVNDYSKNIETKLESMILKIKSIDSVEVFVMIDGSGSVNYLTETEVVEVSGSGGSTSTTTTKVVYEKNGSSTSPIVVGQTNPKITGVLIVTNKISSSTKLSIVNAVASVLNIDTSCINILQDS